ncbi:hypothetical protein O6H91_06G020800 [Diphasiastrum complanatum]|uniref:Uncharacterized protein n=1 Tax=Diphasiastrum complanatum TaxID=34168 RepID=A0ACC2DBB4_DIPCM|nr:hypothetical protein O6H91_06G020800 [Diphasiastrum complanatum]
MVEAVAEKGGNTVNVNVGGKLFVTSVDTLTWPGEGTVLARSAKAAAGKEIFFDRDPELFILIIRLLRTGKLHCKLDSSERDALIDEARFYGVLEALRAALAPAPLDGADVQKSRSIMPNGRDFPSALASAWDGSLWVGHGSKITVYDWALRKYKTTVTKLSTITSLNRISETHVASGSFDSQGLHVYDAIHGFYVKSLIWTDETDPRVYDPSVLSITSSATNIFASCQSGQKTENTILVVDKATLQILRELNRQNGTSAHSKAATRLQWLPFNNLLLTSGVHGSTFGYSGYIKLWDVRSDTVVWNWVEPNVRNARATTDRDCFADVVVSEDLMGVFKVGVASGAVAFADLRNLQSENPWINLIETNPRLEAGTAGPQNKLVTHNNQLYCSRGSEVEVWSELPLAVSQLNLSSEKQYSEYSFRRNFLEQSRRSSGHDVVQMEAGGNRLFVARNELRGIEVWETRNEF